MRLTLPAVALAAAIGAGGAGAAAGQAPVKETRGHAHAHRAAMRRTHVSLHLSRHVALAGNRVVLRGRVRPASRRRVKLVVRGPRGGLASVLSRRDGAFRVRWRPRRPGEYAARAYVVHNRHARAAVSVRRRVTAYRLASASYYGPGFYGGALACGGTLQPGTLGVASRTLPCGSRVKLRYRGRAVKVPVVDRGPYVAGRDFDLTAATKARLGFPDLGVLMSSR